MSRWIAVYDGSSTWSVGEEEDPQNLPPFVTITDSNDERARKNAHKIAATDELLASLKETVRWLERIALSPGEEYPAWERAQAAIEKAEGG